MESEIALYVSLQGLIVTDVTAKASCKSQNLAHTHALERDYSERTKTIFLSLFTRQSPTESGEHCALAPSVAAVPQHHCACKRHTVS